MLKMEKFLNVFTLCVRHNYLLFYILEIGFKRQTVPFCLFCYLRTFYKIHTQNNIWKAYLTISLEAYKRIENQFSKKFLLVQKGISSNGIFTMLWEYYFLDLFPIKCEMSKH